MRSGTRACLQKSRKLGSGTKFGEAVEVLRGAMAWVEVDEGDGKRHGLGLAKVVGAPLVALRRP